MTTPDSEAAGTIAVQAGASSTTIGADVSISAGASSAKASKGGALNLAAGEGASGGNIDMLAGDGVVGLGGSISIVAGPSILFYERIFYFANSICLISSGEGAHLDSSSVGGNVTIVGGRGGGSASLLGGDSDIPGAVAGEAILTGGHATGTGPFRTCLIFFSCYLSVL